MKTKKMMSKNQKDYKRKSLQELGKIYFWTATIRNWICIMDDDKRKAIIINALRAMHEKDLVTIFGFVVMPNHVHIIWRQEKRNGQEMPLASFMKYTSRRLLNESIYLGISSLLRVDHCNKNHEVWKRDSLAIELFSKEVIIQKLNYVHANPVKGKWKLAEDSVRYQFSSSNFYETQVDQFGFLSNIFFEING